MGSSSISVHLFVSSESTQAAMDRVMQQLNSQRLLNITESTNDNPYNFTNLHRNIESINNEEKLDNVVQETPRDTILDSQEIIGQDGMDFDQSNTILETQRTIRGFEVEERVELLHHIHDTMVATTIISSTTAIGQLQNQHQPKGYYKVSIHEAIVNDVSLMITNADDNLPQLLVRDVIETIIAWKWDHIRSMPKI